MVLTLATLFIPPGVSAKIFVGMINLAILCGYSLYFHLTLPSGDHQTPLIGKLVLLAYPSEILFKDLIILDDSFSLQRVTYPCGHFDRTKRIFFTLHSLAKIILTSKLHSELLIKSHWLHPWSLPTGKKKRANSFCYLKLTNICAHCKKHRTTATVL